MPECYVQPTSGFARVVIFFKIDTTQFGLLPGLCSVYGQSSIVWQFKNGFKFHWTVVKLIKALKLKLSLYVVYVVWIGVCNPD